MKHYQRLKGLDDCIAYLIVALLTEKESQEKTDIVEEVVSALSTLFPSSQV